jgi:hypothetical protein
MMKKIFFLVALFVASILFAGATQVSVESKIIKNIVVSDANEPLIFELIIKNYEMYEDEEKFYIFTTEKFDINPSEIMLKGGETKKIRIEILPSEYMKANSGYVNIPMQIKLEGSGESLRFNLPVKLLSFNELFFFNSESITLDSEKLNVYVYNIEDVNYENVSLSFKSTFIDDYNTEIKLAPYEKKSVEIKVSKDKLRNLVFGAYPLTINYNIGGRENQIRLYVNIMEKSQIATSEEKSGLIIKKKSVSKTNEGNIPTIAEITFNKNILSQFFTTFSSEPNIVKRDGLKVSYSWQVDLMPNETKKIDSVTNWIIPFLIVVFIVFIAIFSHMYFSHDLEIKKRVQYVKTKSNDFALKITVNVKAKRFMEKVSIYDRIPAMTKVYDEYNSNAKVDNEKGRLKWDINYLSAGEERSFSYIIYSKVKLLGKFELPSVTGIYEINGKLHEEKSNKVFFINEQEREKD